MAKKASKKDKNTRKNYRAQAVKSGAKKYARKSNIERKAARDKKVRAKHAARKLKKQELVKTALSVTGHDKIMNLKREIGTLNISRLKAVILGVHKKTEWYRLRVASKKTKKTDEQREMLMDIKKELEAKSPKTE